MEEGKEQLENSKKEEIKQANDTKMQNDTMMDIKDLMGNSGSISEDLVKELLKIDSPTIK